MALIRWIDHFESEFVPSYLNLIACFSYLYFQVFFGNEGSELGPLIIQIKIPIDQFYKSM